MKKNSKSTTVNDNNIECVEPRNLLSLSYNKNTIGTIVKHTEIIELYAINLKIK